MMLMCVLLNAMLRRTGESKFFFPVEELNTEQAITVTEVDNGIQIELLTPEQTLLAQTSCGRVQ